MKLWALSDLHRDFYATDIPIPKDADVAVIAGDVMDDDFLVSLSKRIPVVFVAGNHESYGRDIDDRLDELLNLPSARFYLLENDVLYLGDVRFIGCTLWTDFNNGDEAAMRYAYARMSDFHTIKRNGKLFTPQDSYEIHQNSRKWLNYMLSEPFDGKTVVVTHHCPSSRSVAPKYAGDMLNHAFYSDMDAEIERWKPDIWFHGHTHVNFDYVLGETRVLCNPHGYGPRENTNFKPDLIVEI